MKKYQSISFYASILIATCYFTFTLLAFIKYPQAYSPMMNWLSDLGNPSLNPNGAIFYTIGIVLTALLLVLFFLGLSAWKVVGIKTGTIMLRLAQAFGILGSFCMMASGIYPINRFKIHAFWSTSLYILLSTAFVFIVALVIIAKKSQWWLVAIGISTALMVILTAVFPLMYFLEWITVLLFLVFVVLIGIKIKLFNTAAKLLRTHP